MDHSSGTTSTNNKRNIASHHEDMANQERKLSSRKYSSSSTASGAFGPAVMDQQEAIGASNDAYDMNGTHFNADMFIQRITRVRRNDVLNDLIKCYKLSCGN